MIAHPRGLLRKSALCVAVAIVVSFSGRGRADESPVSTNAAKKSEGLLSEEQKRPSKYFRPYRPGETVSGSDIFNSKATPVLPPQAPSPPPSSSRSRELLDRQRNWIFLDGDEKKPDATKEALGVEGSSLEPRKSVITRFLENKSGGETKTNLGETGEINSSLSAQPLTSSLKSWEKNETQDDPRRSSSLQPLPLERNLIGNVAEKARSADLWRERFGVGAAQAREEKEAESRAFLDLFNSRSGVPAASGGITGLSDQNNFGGQPVNPGNRGFGPAPVSSGFTSSLDPFKEAPRRPLGGASVLTEPSFTSPAFGARPAPVLQQEAVKSVAQPAVLPFPKRSF